MALRYAVVFPASLYLCEFLRFLVFCVLSSLHFSHPDVWEYLAVCALLSSIFSYGPIIDPSSYDSAVLWSIYLASSLVTLLVVIAWTVTKRIQSRSD